MAAVTHQFQQRRHPGPQGVGGQAHKTAAVGCTQIDIGRQIGQAGLRVKARCGGLGDQLGQQGQYVVALPVDLHTQ